MARLRINGYNTVALASRVKYSDLKSMTLFTIDDESIFGGRSGGGHAYLAELGFHIVPNRLLPETELLRLPVGMALPMMEPDRKLVVPSAGRGRPLALMRINYVKVQRLDMVYNNRIVVHGVSFPFHQYLQLRRTFISKYTVEKIEIYYVIESLMVHSILRNEGFALFQ